MLEQAVGGECARCGRAGAEGERWCAECGADLRPELPALPTPEAHEAAARSHRWLQDHPERAELERKWRRLEELEARETAAERRVGNRWPVRRATIDDYKPLRLRGLLAARWLAFNVVVLLVSLALTGWHLVLIHGDPSFAVYEASLDRVAIVSAATLVVYLIGAVIFLFWFHRAYANLPSLGATAIRHGTGWAVGGWFVPFLNFVRPKQIADQTWKGSDPDQLDGPPDVDGGSVPAFVDLWWFFWVLGTIGSWVYTRMPVRTLEQEQSAFAVLAAASALDLLAGVFAVVVVRRLTARQEERARRLRAHAA